MDNCEDAYGFPPYPLIAEFLYTSRGVDLRESEREVVCSALAGAPATLLRSTTMDWWQRVPEVMGIAFDEPAVPTIMAVELPIVVDSAEQVV